jgi:hypothetical protein
MSQVEMEIMIAGYRSPETVLAPDLTPTGIGSFIPKAADQ